MADLREASALRHTTVGSSASRSHFSRIPLKLENTYRLEPLDSVSRSAVTKVIKETFESMLPDKSYDERECPKLAKLLSDMIKDQVKGLGYQRYKIVALVALGPSQGASLTYASRFVWNESSDTYADYSYSTNHIFAIGTVYAVYME